MVDLWGAMLLGFGVGAVVAIMYGVALLGIKGDGEEHLLHLRAHERRLTELEKEAGRG